MPARLWQSWMTPQHCYYSVGTLCYPVTERWTQAPLGPQMGWAGWVGTVDRMKTAKLPVFLQLMLSPMVVQCWCRDLIITSRSLRKLDSRAISSSYSRSETTVSNVIFLLSSMSLASGWNTICTPLASSSWSSMAIQITIEEQVEKSRS